MSSSLTDGFFKDVEKIGFLGLGKSNISLLKLLPDGKKIIIRSESPIAKAKLPRGIKPHRIYEGDRAFDNPEEDILFLSPSVRRERPELLKMWHEGIKPCSDLELFLYANKKPIFAVSGSDGKSTTTTIAAALLSDSKTKITPVGNIGTPFVKALGFSSAKYTVAEFSSFCLRYTSPSVKRAVVTNITPNHLNWHKDYEEYREAKISLLNSAEEKIISADDAFLFQYGKKNQVFAVTSFNKGYSEISSLIDASVYYTAENGYIKRNGIILFPISDLSRKESYNIKNMLSALALTDGYAAQDRAKRVAKEFSGLEHRLEEIAFHKGVRFINSSIDTSPARCSESLGTLGNRVIVILGGRGKGTGYRELREPLSSHAILAVITGENRKEIYSDIKGSVDIASIDGFEEAVLYAASVAGDGDTVLLSPASTSYDAFQSFEERGNKFKEIVSQYIKNDNLCK